MKKLVIFFIFLFGFLEANYSSEYFVVKIGQNFTVYTIENYGWGEGFSVAKNETILPDDLYFKNLNIPEAEWAVFSKNQNGVYDSRLEKVEAEKEDLRKDYNKLFASNTVATDRVKVLEILLVISFVGLILFAIGFFQYKIKIKNCVNLKQKIKEASAKND